MAICIREMEASQRPRERLLEYGPAVLSDAELLAVLLRTGRRGSGAVEEGHGLLVSAGGLAGLARWAPQELMRRPGLGPAKAATLLAALELGHRVARSELAAAERLDQPQSAGEFLRRRLGGERQEVFGLLCLDSRHRLVRIHELTRGTRRQAPVDAAEVFRRALLDDAAGAIVFHNHPSGELEPSRDDLRLTERLARAGDILGVTLLDHILVAGPRWLSLRSARPGLFVADM